MYEIDKIQRACEHFSIAYVHHPDFQRYEDFPNLFAEQGMLAVGDEIHGAKAIA